MTAPAALLAAVLGGRAKSPHLPNISDSANPASRAISIRMLELLGLRHDPDGPDGVRLARFEGQAAGTELERQVETYLRRELPKAAPERHWLVEQKGRKLSDFEQYAHLATLQRLINDDKTNTLAIAIGRDYEVKPDVTVGEIVQHVDRPLLHASVSCKLTLRSDRAQNVRIEASLLNRHRKGRQPHIVAVTIEPLPSRLTSLARGTGDVDALYHVALDALQQAVSEVGGKSQQRALDEIVGQRRLLDFDDLVTTLAV